MQAFAAQPVDLTHGMVSAHPHRPGGVSFHGAVVQQADGAGASRSAERTLLDLEIVEEHIALDPVGTSLQCQASVCVRLRGDVNAFPAIAHTCRAPADRLAGKAAGRHIYAASRSEAAHAAGIHVSRKHIPAIGGQAVHSLLNASVSAELQGLSAGSLRSGLHAGAAAGKPRRRGCTDGGHALRARVRCHVGALDSCRASYQQAIVGFGAAAVGAVSCRRRPIDRLPGSIGRVAVDGPPPVVKDASEEQVVSVSQDHVRPAASIGPEPAAGAFHGDRRAGHNSGLLRKALELFGIAVVAVVHGVAAFVILCLCQPPSTVIAVTGGIVILEGHRAQLTQAVVAELRGQPRAVGDPSQIALVVVGEGGNRLRTAAVIGPRHRGDLPVVVLQHRHAIAVGALRIAQHAVFKIAAVSVAVRLRIVAPADGDGQSRTIFILIRVARPKIIMDAAVAIDVSQIAAVNPHNTLLHAQLPAITQLHTRIMSAAAGKNLAVFTRAIGAVVHMRDGYRIARTGCADVSPDQRELPAVIAHVPSSRTTNILSLISIVIFYARCVSIADDEIRAINVGKGTVQRGNRGISVPAVGHAVLFRRL